MSATETDDDRELAQLFSLLNKASALAERLGLDVRIDLRPLAREAHGFPPAPPKAGTGGDDMMRATVETETGTQAIRLAWSDWSFTLEAERDD